MIHGSNSDNAPRLQVLVCTLGAEGLNRVAEMSLPRVPGVGYLVACQSSPLPLPSALVRDDVEVHFSPTRGLTKNRNFAFSCARAEYALIADDDLIFSAEGLLAVIDAFERCPNVDIACFRCDFPFKKIYPTEEMPLPAKAKGYYVTSYEIAVRLSSIRKAGLQFNELMGIGAPRFHSGEEAVFIENALAKGLSVRFFPITIVTHPGIPTGRQTRQSTGAIEAEGVVIAMKYRFTLLPRLLLKARRLHGNFFSNLRYLLRGAWFYLRHKEKFC